MREGIDQPGLDVWPPDDPGDHRLTDRPTDVYAAAAFSPRKLPAAGGVLDIAFAAGDRCLLYGVYTRSTQDFRVEAQRLSNRCVFEGGSGPDRLHGTIYRDFLYGFGDDDRLAGDQGQDLLDGASGADVILAGWGPDTVIGGAGADRITGDRGFDVLVAGPGRDVVSAGRGDDSVFVRDSSRDVVRCGAGRDRVRADARDVVAADCENVER